MFERSSVSSGIFGYFRKFLEKSLERSHYFQEIFENLRKITKLSKAPLTVYLGNKKTIETWFLGSMPFLLSHSTQYLLISWACSEKSSYHSQKGNLVPFSCRVSVFFGFVLMDR